MSEPGGRLLNMDDAAAQVRDADERHPALLRPLVVGTCGRSGSTMTMALLSTSPRVAMDREHPYEHAYFAWMAEWAALADRTEWDVERWNAPGLWRAQVRCNEDGLVGPPPWQSRPLWEARNGDRDRIGPDLLLAGWREFSARAAARTRSDLDAPDADVRYHAEKAVHVARLRELSPITVYNLVVHRDPRDVWLSIEAFNKARGFYGFGRRAEDSPQEWLERFLAWQTLWLRTTLGERNRRDSLVVAFEDLVSQPEAVSAQIEDWLGLELDPAMLAIDLQNNTSHATSASPGEAIGRWKHELDPDLAERFAADMGPELLGLGYEV